MAYVITDSCVNCGTCEGECPVGAISAGDSKYEIDASSCVVVEHVLVPVLQELSSPSNMYMYK